MAIERITLSRALRDRKFEFTAPSFMDEGNLSPRGLGDPLKTVPPISAVKLGLRKSGCLPQS